VFECDIDARGKAYRLKYGIYGIIAGFVLSGMLILADLETWMVWLIPVGLVGGVPLQFSKGGLAGV
jgi:hypothetical protein